MKRERDIEYWLRGRIEGLGGVFMKFVSPGNAGVPDRVAVMPGGQVWFIELKTDKGRLTPIQSWQQERIRKRGVRVRTVRGTSGANELIDDMIEQMAEDARRRQGRDAVQAARLPEAGDGTGAR